MWWWRGRTRWDAGKAAVAGLLGDVDGDGRVDVADALVVAAYSVNATGLVPWGGDVDGDGEVNGEDARLLALYSVDPGHPGLPVGIGLPVGASVVGRVPSLVRGGEVLLSSVDGQVLAETTTDDAGDGFAFAVRSDGLPAWVLVTAVGGVGLDADGDGVVDRVPMAKPGRLRAWVGREYVAEGQGVGGQSADGDGLSRAGVALWGGLEWAGGRGGRGGVGLDCSGFF